MLCNVQHSMPKENESANMQLVRALNVLVQRLPLEAMHKFDLCILLSQRKALTNLHL